MTKIRNKNNVTAARLGLLLIMKSANSSRYTCGDHLDMHPTNKLQVCSKMINESGVIAFGDITDRLFLPGNIFLVFLYHRQSNKQIVINYVFGATHLFKHTV